jgi:hypothetical protein
MKPAARRDEPSASLFPDRDGQTLLAVIETPKGARNKIELDPRLLDEIEEFFRSYNGMKGDRFRPPGLYAARRASKLVRRGLDAARRAARQGEAAPMRVSPLSHALVGRAAR